MAIIYSYPKITSPLATDVLVLTDTTVTAGKRKNKTKSIAMSDVANYVIDTKSSITGTGTLNTFPIFTASTIIGDSIITQSALGQGITVGGNFDVTNDTNLQGSLLADSLEVTNDSVFIGSARFNGTIKDTSGGVGTNGQVLTSTGTGVAWTTDAGGSVTGTGTTNYIAKWDTSSSIQDSIIFDNGTNVGIGTNSPASKLHVAGDIRTDTRILFTGTGFIKSNATNLELETVSNKDIILNPEGTGNVGIGTTNPTEKLDIFSDSNAVIRLESNGGGVGMLDVGTDFTINNTINTNLIFKTSNTEKMRITNSGNVGIGTTNPSQKLEISEGYISSSGAGTSHGFELKRSGLDTYRLRHLDSGLTVFNDTDGRKEMTFDGTGNVGIGTGSPGQKLDVSGNIAIQSGGSSSDSNYISMVGSRAIFGYDGSISSAYMRSSDTSKPLVFGSASSEFMRIVSSSGNVGIGTTSPASKLEVDGGDIEVDDSANGLILRSPNGTRYRVQVDNSGNLTRTAI